MTGNWHGSRRLCRSPHNPEAGGRAWPRMRTRPIVPLLLLLAATSGCFSPNSPGLRIDWQAGLTTAAFSSPLLVDLNGDGVLDVVAAAGPWALMPSDADPNWHELVALDGRSGSLLWSLETGPIDASPALAGTTGGQPVIAVGLREWGELALVAGGSWQARLPLHNWVHSPAVADLDGDGKPEIVAVTGGLEPGEDGHAHDHTHPNGGTSGLPGEIVATDANLEPLWKHELSMEAYTSPAILAPAGGRPGMVFLGLGGEMHEGGAFEARSGATGEILWSEPTRTGVVASPALLEINGEAAVVFLEWWGGLHARSVSDGAPLWDQDTRHISLTSPALAHLDEDGQLDIIATGMRTPGLQLETFEAGHNDKGALSTADAGVAIAYSGSNGTELWRRDWHSTPGTPVTADMDGDGLAEVILVLTHGSKGVVATSGGSLLILDGATGETKASLKLPSGAVATPAVADMDGDGRADAVVATTAPGGVLRINSAAQTQVEVPGSWPRWRGDAQNTGNPTP